MAARDALLERFLAAAEEGDLEALEELLAKDAVLYADHGGKAMAPREPIFGAADIAHFMAAVAGARLASGDVEATVVRVNGQPGRVVRGPAEQAPGAGIEVWSVLTVDVVDGRIQTVRIVRNPDKLGHL